MEGQNGKICVSVLAIVMLAASFTAGCIGNDDDDDKIGVIVTIAPLKEFAERVGGDRVKVTVMVPPGEDPHGYEPTPGQMKAVARAGLYFKVGSGLEFENAWMATIEDQNSDMPVVDGSTGIDLIPIGGGGYDLHGTADQMFGQGPFEEVAAGSNESAAPMLDAGEKCYNLTLKEDDGNWSGIVRFTPDAPGEFVIFLEHDADELNFTLKDGEGKTVPPGDHEGDAATRARDGEGRYFGWSAAFDLHDDNYTLEFGPAGVGKCKLVILEDLHEENDHGHETMDPHIWTSPRNAGVMVRNLLEGLKQVDPGNSDYYSGNADVYLAELDALDGELETGLADLRGAKFMVYHPAFGYLAHDYGLVQIAIEDEGKEPTPAGLQALIDQAKAEGIRVVFVSPQFDEHNAQTIADEIGGEVVLIDSLGEDYLENMLEVKTKLIQGLAR